MEGRRGCVSAFARGRPRAVLRFFGGCCEWMRLSDHWFRAGAIRGVCVFAGGFGCVLGGVHNVSRASEVARERDHSRKNKADV